MKPPKPPNPFAANFRHNYGGSYGANFRHNYTAGDAANALARSRPLMEQIGAGMNRTLQQATGGGTDTVMAEARKTVRRAARGGGW